MTILEALTAKVNYPMPEALFQSILIEAGLDPAAEFTQEIGQSKDFEIAWAKSLISLVTAPNITEGDYSISLDDRDSLIRFANSIFTKWDEPVYGEPTIKFRADWC